MDLTGNVWRIYPGDAPGIIGRASPRVSEIFCHRIIWQPDSSSQAGDAVHLKDRNGLTVFFHEAAAGETEFLKEYAAPLQGPLELAALASGAVEIVIE